MQPKQQRSRQGREAAEQGGAKPEQEAGRQAHTGKQASDGGADSYPTTMIMTGAARLMRVFRRKEKEADEGQGQLSYLGDH